MFQLLHDTQKDKIQKEQGLSACWRELDPQCAAAAAQELTASPPCLSPGRVSRKGGFGTAENRQP